MLVLGGIWVNLGTLHKVTAINPPTDIHCPALGPLLWHHENNNTGDVSIEASLDEVKELAKAIGFEISVSILNS